MDLIARWTGSGVAAAFILTLLASPATAQEEEKELGWAFEAELGSLWTGGNQETTTLSASGKLEYVWPTSRFRFQAGGFTTESSLTTTTAVGTGQNDFRVIEDKATEKTAETYYSRTRFDHDISERFFVVGGVDWLRNPFSGIDSRFLVAAGAGNKWVQSDRLKFETDYFVTYTFEQEVVSNPITESNFPGLRVGYDLEWLLTQSTKLESSIVADLNLDNTDDVRLDWYNGLPIDISSVLAFKPGLRLLWRNDPALQDVPLFDAPGGTQNGTVMAPLRKLDSYFSVALVFKF